MDLTLFLQQFLNGLSIGSVYAIFALGYTLVFSILGIINFAHGAVFTLGAYFTYTLMGGAFGFNGLLANAKIPVQLPFAVALILGSTLAGLVGVIVERVAPIRTVQIVIFGVAVAIVSLLTYLINFTKFGKAMQAVAEDATTSSLLGINTDRYIVLTFFVSSFLAGLAGGLVGSSVSIAGPYFGIAFGLKGLAVIVLGGLGSIPGAVLGGFMIGLVEAFVPGDFSAYKDAVAFAILFIMLLVRPQGLFGRRLIEKV